MVTSGEAERLDDALDVRFAADEPSSVALFPATLSPPRLGLSDDGVEVGPREPPAPGPQCRARFGPTRRSAAPGRALTARVVLGPERTRPASALQSRSRTMREARLELTDESPCCPSELGSFVLRWRTSALERAAHRRRTSANANSANGARRSAMQPRERPRSTWSPVRALRRPLFTNCSNVRRRCRRGAREGLPARSRPRRPSARRRFAPTPATLSCDFPAAPRPRGIVHRSAPRVRRDATPAGEQRRACARTVQRSRR